MYKHTVIGPRTLAAALALTFGAVSAPSRASQPDGGPAGQASHIEPRDPIDPATTEEPVIPTPANPDTPREGMPMEDPEPTEAPPTPAPAHPHTDRGRVAPQPDLPHRPGDPERLELPGLTGAWFYRPQGGGRRPRVLVYLHARNADPRESCRTFHSIASRFGWLLCPIGPVEHGNGRREWRNDRDYANRETIVAIETLAARFPGRVRRHDNVIMGFSEGAYVGMNVALMNPQTFPRWFIIAADDRYIESEADRIRRAAHSVQRVYFLTGETDSVVDHTQRAYSTLERVWGHRHIHMRVLEGAGHELPPNFVSTVRRILYWVAQPPPVGAGALAGVSSPEAPPVEPLHPETPGQ